MNNPVKWFACASVLALCLITVPALAGDDVSPTLFPSNGLTIIRPMQNMSIITSQEGSQMTIFQTMPGMSWYSTENKYGRITSQGYLFDPFGKREPLTVPSVDRYAPDRDRHTR